MWDDATRLPKHENIPTLLRLHIHQMPPAPQKAAELLLQEGFHLQDFSVTELAQKACVSTAAIVRMCQILGYRGFRDFRLDWAREAGIRTAAGDKPSVTQSDVESVVAHTRELLNPDVLEKAADAIYQSHRLLVYGGGSSSLVASLAARAFTYTGFFALAFNANDLQETAHELTDVGTVILVISHRGHNTEIEARVEHDRRRGAHVVLITSNPHSNLTTLADTVLVTGGQGARVDSRVDLPARIAQIMGVHELVERVMQKRVV